MELQELRNNEHLSASSIGDYLDCGLLFKFGRVDKLKPEGKSDAMEFGSAIHLVMADIYQSRLTGIELSIKEIQESFEKHWTRLVKNSVDLQYSEGKDFETLLLEGKELLTTYYHKRPKADFRIIAIEESFSFLVKGCSIPIIGAIDLIEEDEGNTIILTDHKTSSRAYSRDEVDRNFQLTLYQLALRSLGYEDREILLKFDCFIKTKTPKFEQYYTTRSEVDEKRAIRKIVEVQNGISKGVFIPNDSPSNWKCKGCAFKKSCDEWFIKEAA